MAEFKTYNSTTIDSKVNAKQDTLVSGTNIKTINGESVLGSGDLTVSSSPTALYKHNLLCIANRVDSENDYIYFTFSIINTYNVPITIDNCNTYLINGNYYSVSGFGSIDGTLEQFIVIQYLPDEGNPRFVIGFTVSHLNNSFNANMEYGYQFKFTSITDSISSL